MKASHLYMCLDMYVMTSRRTCANCSNSRCGRIPGSIQSASTEQPRPLPRITQNRPSILPSSGIQRISLVGVRGTLPLQFCAGLHLLVLLTHPGPMQLQQYMNASSMAAALPILGALVSTATDAGMPGTCKDAARGGKHALLLLLIQKSKFCQHPTAVT